MESEPVIKLPIPFLQEEELSEETCKLKNPFMEGVLTILSWEHTHIIHGLMKPTKPQVICFDFDTPVINLYFSLSGHQNIYSTIKHEQLFKENTCNLLYNPYPILYQDNMHIKNTNNAIHITLSIAYFKERMHMVYPILDIFKYHIEHMKFSWLSEENLSITPEMRSILNEIITCKQEGLLKILFMEAKIIKLIMLLLEQFEQFKLPLGGWLKPKDIQNIKWVKTYIDNNFSQAHSLIILAKKAGLNDYKLKKGFKAMYGTTVFAYLNDIRMLHAKKLLLANHISISEIALSCGYQYVQNFTKAFKKKHGITPDKFRSSKI